MGKFADNLMHAIRGRRAAKRVKWPTGFKGMVIWCPLCTMEIARVSRGHSLDAGMQKALVDAHAESCPRAKLRLAEQK